MKNPSLIALSVLLGGAFSLQAQNLVTNGDFENYALAGTPPGWNTPVGAGFTGQFQPGGPPGFPLAPLSGSVAYMGAGTQVFQTFAGVALQPGTKYTVTFDAYISVGPSPATLTSTLCYGSGSGETSAYNGEILPADMVKGSHRYVATLSPAGQRFSYTFVTKTVDDGFTGFPSDIAMYFVTTAGQIYLDNVSVTATAATAADLAPHDGGLVTNGDFNNGGVYGGASPTGWNSTVGAAGTGQFVPGGGPPAPLSGAVAYMETGTQMFQTFAGVKLQPGTRYTVSFDANVSAGTGETAYLFADISYGTGSGGTSSFGGAIDNSDLMRGGHAYFAPLSSSGQRFSYTFVTKTLADGFTGSASDIALYVQPSTGFGVVASQLYLDNVSVKATPVSLAELVINGDFENYALAGAPPGWNTTLGAGGTGQFAPGGGPQPPLSGSVAYMSTGTQMFQTFEGVKLLPDAAYFIAFDSYISVGFVDEANPFAYLFADISYGLGSGGTSTFHGYIKTSDLASGTTAYLAPITTTAGSFAYSFTTKSIAEGFVGTNINDVASDIAIYLQPSTGFGVNAAQCYIDNLSVVVAVPSVDADAPVLSITRSGSNVILSWPEDVSGWTLESSTDLGNLDDWSPVPGVVANSVTVPLNGSKEFFRLKKN